MSVRDPRGNLRGRRVVSRESLDDVASKLSENVARSPDDASREISDTLDKVGIPKSEQRFPLRDSAALSRFLDSIWFDFLVEGRRNASRFSADFWISLDIRQRDPSRRIF